MASFCFLLFKRQTDGLTELDACWTLVILKWNCMLKKKRCDDLVWVNHRSQISQNMKLLVVCASFNTEQSATSLFGRYSYKLL